MAPETMLIKMGECKPTINEIAVAIRRNAGSMIFVSDPPCEIKDDVSFGVGVMVERHLYDSETNEFMVKFVHFNRVFTSHIERSNNNYHLVLPTRGEIIEKANSRVSNFRSGSETALLKAMGSKIIDITPVNNQLTPIFEIVQTVIAKESVEVNDFITANRGFEKAQRYLNFLYDLDIITMEESRYYGGKFILQQIDSGKEKREIYKAIVAETIRKGYTYMADFLHFTHIMPYLRLGNSSFLPSFHADKILKMRVKDLDSRFVELYGQPTINESKTRFRANQMGDVGVFDVDRDQYSGNAEVFDDYINAWGKKATILAH